MAYELKKQLSDFDVVLDIHATNSNVGRLIIVTNFNKATKNILKNIPIKKVALVRKKVFGGQELITHCKNGIALEYGPNKSGRNYKEAVRDVKVILRNFGMISGNEKIYREKELFSVSGVYKVPKTFVTDKNLKDYELIKKNQVIGVNKGKDLLSSKSFYPLFLGKGRYEDSLSMVSSKQKITL